MTSDWPPVGSVVVATGKPPITGVLGPGYYQEDERSVTGPRLRVLVYSPSDLRPPTPEELATYQLEKADENA